MSMCKQPNEVRQVVPIAEATIGLANEMLRAVSFPGSDPARELQSFYVWGFAICQADLMASVLLLANNGRYSAANHLARTMLEGMVRLRWLLKEPVKRLERWGRFYPVEQYMLALELEAQAHPSPERQQELLARVASRKQELLADMRQMSLDLLTRDARQALKEGGDLPDAPADVAGPRAAWGGLTFQEIREQVMRELAVRGLDAELWPLVYGALSGPVHWSPLHVVSALPAEKPDVSHARLNRTPEGSQALVLGTLSLLFVLDGLNDIAGLGRENDIRVQLDALKAVVIP
jgi:hypothetical protein